MKEGQKLRVLTAPAGLGHMQPLRVIIAGDSKIEAAAALSDQGTYVPVDIRNIDTSPGPARTTAATTTVAACGSIRASTRRRYAITCPTP